MLNDDVSTLNTLIATTLDSINGYEEAAKDAGGQFAQIFRQNAQERRQVVGALQQEVRRLGGNPEDDQSLLGKAHNIFTDLKAAITGRDDKAIINEVERGEDYLKEKFETALASDSLSADTRSAIQQAYSSVRRGHDEVRNLKQSMEGTSASSGSSY